MKNSKFFTGMVLQAPLINFMDYTPSLWDMAVVRIASKVFPEYEYFQFPVECISSDSSMVNDIRQDDFRYKGGVKVHMGFAMLDAMSVRLHSNLNLFRHATIFNINIF